MYDAIGCRMQREGNTGSKGKGGERELQAV